MHSRPVGGATVTSPAPSRRDACEPTNKISDAWTSGVFRHRFDQEYAWLSGIAGVNDSVARGLAARAAASYLHIRGLAADCTADFPGLPADTRNRVVIRNLLPDWFPPHASDGAVLEQQVAASVEAMWPLVASTEELLASGGDERLDLDPRTRANRYGCTPWPREDIISFGSCTASCVTQRGFAAAEAERRRLVADAVATSPARALAAAAERIIDSLLMHYDVDHLATGVLAASGTDAALLVTGLLAAEDPGRPLFNILVSPSETGSGVPNAVQGRHFAMCAPGGRAVGKGEPIDGFGRQHFPLSTVALRDQAGVPRPDAVVLSEVEAAIIAGLAHGRVVLHAIDGSKTGLTAPGRAACRRLAETYGAALDIVIDACQARIEPALVRWYLAQGFPVLVTGSKFFGAPGFCGAVLFPRCRFERITQSGRLPSGLAAYARLQDGFGSRRCPGLVLRWTAALAEMAAFSMVPPASVRAQLTRFAGYVQERLSANIALRLMEAPRPEGMGWSDCPSVLTFAVRGPDGWLSPPALRRVYEALAAGSDGVGCQIGQPVELGHAGLGGLRLAVSAAQLADSACPQEALSVVLGQLDALIPRVQARIGL